MAYRATITTVVLLSFAVILIVGSGVWVATTPDAWIRGAIVFAWVAGYACAMVALPRLERSRNRSTIGGVVGCVFTVTALLLPHRYEIIMLAFAATAIVASLERDRRRGRLWRGG
jgi:hypothetical protein